DPSGTRSAAGADISRAKEVVDDEVDQLDADERRDEAPQSIDQHVAAQKPGCADRPVSHPTKPKREQGGNYQSVEDDRREDRRFGGSERHDVERVERPLLS